MSQYDLLSGSKTVSKHLTKLFMYVVRIGAYMMHIINGIEQLVAYIYNYALQTLSQAERNFMQIEHQALALIFSMYVCRRLISTSMGDSSL